MRVGFVSQAYPPRSQGGIATQTALKAAGLARLGHDVRVLSYGDEASMTVEDSGVTVIRVPGPDHRMQIWNEAARWVTWSGEVAAAIAAEQHRAPFDIVDFPEWGAEGYVHLLNRGPDGPAATVHVHGPLAMLAHALGWPSTESDLYRVGMHMERTCLALADSVYSSSDLSTDWCAKYHDVDRDRVPTLHAGVDTKTFTPAGSPPSRPTIVFVGRIARNKGIEELVAAIAALRPGFPDLRLVVVGSGDAPYTERVKASVVELGISDAVDFLGSVDRDDLPGVLRSASVFAGPSHYEGGPGLVYLEAMAAGLPVVACSGSGAMEVVRDGENGVLVPPADPDSLADAIGRLLRDDSLREALGAQARSDAVGFDAEICTQRLETYYLEVLGGRS